MDKTGYYRSDNEIIKNHYFSKVFKVNNFFKKKAFF